MKICVIGLGYIGLPTACLLAGAGHSVVGFDISKKRLDEIREKKVSMNEEGFQDLFRKAGKNLTVQDRVSPADVFVITVPTPVKDGQADLSHLRQAASSVSDVLEKGNLVILESTVPPGTTEKTGKDLGQETGLEPGKDFFVSHCPERAFPGNLLQELVHNDRIIGTDSEKSRELTAEIYRSFSKGKLFFASTKTAEFTKLIENTYRNVNIAFANELALLAEKKGMDAYRAIELANRHPRVNIHQPGAGVGGHCIPVDPWFLVGQDTKIIRQSLLTNERMPGHMVELLERGLEKAGKKTADSKIVVLGASFKPDVSDTRNSPALPVTEKLKDAGAEVSVHDPHAKDFKYPVSSDISVLKGADAVMIVTAHSEYRKMDWEKTIREMAETPVIIDGRNLLKKPDNAIYLGVGK